MTAVKLITWNVKMLPGILGGNGLGGLSHGQRVSAMVEHISAAQFDIVCLQEVFDEDRRDQFTRELSALGYRCTPKLATANPLTQDSGLFAAVRNGVVHWDGAHRFEAYADSAGNDSGADKGVVGLRLAVPDGGESSLAFWLFVSHTQADLEHAEVRRAQFAQARRFIAACLAGEASPDGVMAYLCGDLNVVGDSEEHQDMIERLGYPVDEYFAAYEDQQPGYTWDGPNNPLAGDEDQQRLDYWLRFVTMPGTDDVPEVDLFTPSVVSVDVVQAKHGGHFLSDHYAVALALTV